MKNTDTSYPVIYTPGETGIISMIGPDGRCQYSGLTAEELLDENDGAVILPFSDAWDEIQVAAIAKFTHGPKEITSDRFNDMLNVLPPMDYRSDSNGESFKISERTWGNITAIFARIGEKFFELSDNDRLPHQEIMALCARVK